nr:keto-valine-ferredoxin oxidoreductase beta-subunit, VOR beta {N-terminal} [Thermococcus litoralis, DSM 5473, Peptide Partial, 15 aa] [Thermococcus litoralis]
LELPADVKKRLTLPF